MQGHTREFRILSGAKKGPHQGDTGIWERAPEVKGAPLLVHPVPSVLLCSTARQAARPAPSSLSSSPKYSPSLSTVPTLILVMRKGQGQKRRRPFLKHSPYKTIYLKISCWFCVSCFLGCFPQTHTGSLFQESSKK